MRYSLVRATAAALFALAAPMIAGGVHAEEVDYSNPYGDAAHGALRFSSLEASMPIDPLLWSGDSGWKPHHTPADVLVPAHDALRTAIPRGTAAADARLALVRAGARCGAAAGAELDCRYSDVETPRRGMYTDDVTWLVKVALVDGRAGHIDVARDWTRH